ncbi:hypothetical protein MD484_g7258, partial [Candolleomyces efflorescens]
MAGSPIEFKEYNLLPPVKVAHAILTEANSDKWLQLIAPILAEEDPEGRYALCLVHGHHELFDGERMVSTGLITMPDKTREERVIPSAWNIEGRPYEWTRLGPNDPFVPAPPETLFARLRGLFGSLVPSPGVGSVMGISIRGPKLDEGMVWWENLDNKKRSHVIQQRPRSDVASSSDVVLTLWIPERNGDLVWVLACCGVCHH